MPLPRRATTVPFVVVVLALLLPLAAAQVCTPGHYGLTASSCTTCAGSTYSYGALTGPCASCQPGAIFVAASAGCTPPTAATVGPYSTALYLSGSSTEGVSAFAATGASGLSYVTDHLGVASNAMSVALGSYLVSAPLPQLPTGMQPRSITAWLKCPVPATTLGRMLFDFWDGTTSPLTEHFSVFAGVAIDSQVAGATSVVLNDGTQQQQQYQYAASTFAGNAAATYLNGVGSSAGFSNPVGITCDVTTGNLYVRHVFLLFRFLPSYLPLLLHASLPDTGRRSEQLPPAPCGSQRQRDDLRGRRAVHERQSVRLLGQWQPRWSR